MRFSTPCEFGSQGVIVGGAEHNSAAHREPVGLGRLFRKRQSYYILTNRVAPARRPLQRRASYHPSDLERSSVKYPDRSDFEGFSRLGESLYLQESGVCWLDFLQIDRGVWS
jgi:hypothetical protein